MKKKRIEFITTTMLVAFLLISIPNGYAQQATGAFPEERRAIAAYGKEAESFASLISNGADFKVTSGVIDDSAAIIISDLRNVDLSKVAYALRNRAIVVALNLPANNDLIPVPTLEENIAGVEFMINSEDGTVLSERIIQESAKTIYPEYWIGIIRHDEAISVSYYALMADSPQQLVKLLETTAEKVANMVPSGTYAEASGSYPEPGSEWTKKLDVEYTWDLAGDDQLYTRYEVFELKFWDEVTMKEYWRTDSYIDHWLPSYVQEMGHCGPYISTRQIFVDATSADLYDYDPPTTATGAGASVSIGFTVTTGGVGVNVGYSWSWSNPGVKYDVGADYVNDKITWDETFNGPDYTWWPFYGGPTEASHNSYNAKTTAIMRSPVGSGCDISTLQSKWVKYDDFMSWDPWNPFIWWLTRYIDTYTTTWSPGQLASMFVPPNTPSTPSGPTSGYTYSTYTYTTSTTDPNGDSIWYKFSWGDGSYTTVGPYLSGATASASHYWSSIGIYYVRVKAKDSAGLWSGWSSSHTVSISSGGGGGGCPTLFVWDGEEYAEEGILDIHADSDVTVQHWIQNTLALENSIYKLQLRELDEFTSHIDQVKLYAVDGEGEWCLCPLTYAYHNELGKVKHTLRFDDDNRVDLKPTEIIDLKFGQPIPYSETEYFIFEINGYNLKPLMENK